MSDMVNHPAHYTSGTMECIEAIEAQLTREQFVGFLKGQVAKYLWRLGKKGGGARGRPEGPVVSQPPCRRPDGGEVVSESNGTAAVTPQAAYEEREQ